MKNFNSRQLETIFLNKEINLLARSESHSKVLHKNFKSPVGIVHNWDHKQIAKYI